MAVYRLFPEKDTFIFTENQRGNAGLDEILEIGSYPILGIGQASRILVKFNSEELRNVIDNIIGTPHYTSSLNLKLAYAQELPTEFNINAYPLYESWDNGIGKFHDIPYNSSGVSWNCRQAEETLEWSNGTNTPLPPGVEYYSTEQYPGGGNWYTGSNGVNLSASQKVNLNSDLDINIDVSAAVELHYTNLITNNGFIVKLDNDLEFSITSFILLKYFSKDTNTIYPPYLEIKWDDSMYETVLPLLQTDNSVFSIINNKGEYIDEGVQRFRIAARPRYPQRVFTTGSIYKTNYRLPQNTTWGLQDTFTEEMLIDFDDRHTKVSADDVSSYFDVYMGGLQPERSYRILLKTEIGGSTTLVDGNNLFKVVRNV